MRNINFCKYVCSAAVIKIQGEGQSVDLDFFSIQQPRYYLGWDPFIIKEKKASEHEEEVRFHFQLVCHRDAAAAAIVVVIGHDTVFKVNDAINQVVILKRNKKNEIWAVWKPAERMMIHLLHF